MRKNIKALMIGIISREYIRDNWLLPLQELCEVRYVSVSVLTRVMSLEKISEYMLKVFYADSYDYVFYYADGMHQIFQDRFFKEVRKTTPVIAFYSDDEPYRWMSGNTPFDHRSDFIATHSKRACEHRKNAGYDNGVMYLQWGYNPKQFFPMNIEKDVDVVFMGSNFFGDGRYYHDGEFRQKFLTEVYNYCQKKGYSFRLYGNHWDDHPILKEAWGGFIPDSEINSVINSAKIVIGLGYTVDENPTYQTKLKHFEIAGAGTFQLVNTNPDIEEIFGENIPQAKDIDDFCEKITYFLENEEQRETFAKEAHKICAEKCTTRDRLISLFETADKYYYPNASDVAEIKTEESRIKVATVEIDKDLSNFDEVVNKINKLKDENVSHIRFFEKENESLDFNKGLLEGVLKKGNSIRIDVLYSMRNSNENEDAEKQRRTFDDNAFLIKGEISKNNIWYRCVRETSAGFEKADSFIPLHSIISDIDSAEQLLRDCVAQRCDFISGLSKTDFIIGDYRLHPSGDYWKYNEKKALRKFLEINKDKGQIVIWGAYSMLTKQIFEVLNDKDEVYNVVFADRNSYEAKINVGDKESPLYYPIINSSELLEGTHIKPYAVVIGAINSGESMVRMLKERNVNYKVLPLFDLDNEVWKQEGVF